MRFLSLSGGRTGRLRRRTILLCALLTAAAVSAAGLAVSRRDYATARNEYTALRIHAPSVVAPALPAAPPAETSPAPPGLCELNPDYIGWIQIAGTNVDYPVVRGQDNLHYLTHTFSGAYNRAGAIFMDTRCAEGFGGDLAILYGHNMKDGSMFGALHAFLDSDYLEGHRALAVADRDGNVRAYRIVAAILTDVYDPVYTLPGGGREETEAYLTGHGIPADASALIFSTCTNSPRKDDRLLVFASQTQQAAVRAATELTRTAF